MGMFSRVQNHGVSIASITNAASEDAEPRQGYRLGDDVFWDCSETQLHGDAHALGGLGCHDPTLLSKQQKAISEWIATLGKKLLTGSLSSTPAPVAIFEARSHLQKIAEPWGYMDFLLAAAAATTKLERLQLVLAWTIAGLRHTHTWQKPFNPVLGETWRAEAAGGRVSAHIEQVSHHPPVARYTVTGPGFRMHGTSELGIQVSMKYRGFKQTFKGLRTIQFDDGDIVEFLEGPAFLVKSVLSLSDARGDIVGAAMLRLSGPGGILAAHVNFGPVAGAAPPCSRTDGLSGYIVELTPGARASAAGGVDGESDGRSSGPSSPRGAGSSLALESRSSAAFDSASLHAGSGDEGLPTVHGSPGKGRFMDKLRRGRAIGLSERPSALSHMRSGGGSSAPLPAAASAETTHHSTSGSLLPSMSSVSSWLRSTQDGADGDAPPANAVATLRGSWLSHLDLTPRGGKPARLWTLCDCNPGGFNNAPEGRRLPTDCTFRKDIQLLAAGDVKGAEAAKQQIEEQQRRLRKQKNLS